MMTVLGCIAHEHNPWLVLVALLVGLAGSWLTSRLFLRTLNAQHLQRFGWHFLTGVAAAVAVWCTHFIAMLGFNPRVPVMFDTTVTMLSLLIALTGTTAGFLVAADWRAKCAPAVGGAIVGLAIALMHYTGMQAYRVQGIVTWNLPGVVASVALAVVLSAIALQSAIRGGRHAGNIMAGTMALAIATLHFTGMSAFQVEPAQIGGAVVDLGTQRVLAFAVACAAFVIVAVGLVAWLLDNGQRNEAMEQLRLMALTDPLTGLPNRSGVGRHLDTVLPFVDAQAIKLALVGIDLNRFKEINDLRGHQAGDDVLRLLAQRVTELIGTGEFIGRVGGDEFIATKAYVERTDLVEFVTRLEAAFAKPIGYGNWEFVTGASLGVAVYPDDAKDKVELMSNADLAMYRAKADLTRSICFYEPAMDEMVKNRLRLAADLRAALAHRQFHVFYQVQTSVVTGRPTGYEALIRWQHPQRGLVPPAEFIPIAEETGLILEIGEWVLREACLKASTWGPPYKVSVNVSAVQFAHANLPKLIRDVLAETKLPAERLELELTESTIFVDRKRALQVLEEIKALGVGIALDDFGTGYSSLGTLRAFPFDKIKLDRSFMNEVESNPQSKAIIRAVLAIGKSLGIPVLAEGIETQAQLTLLENEGCDEIQGFLIGRPAPLSLIVASGQLTLTGATPQEI